jgi:hypothetical protein
MCVVGNTGPGGGIVFYVHPGGGTFASPGSDCGTTCRYLEAAPSDQSTGIVWATSAEFCYNIGSSSSTNNCQRNSVYSGDDTAQNNSLTAATGIGQGMANTNQIYARLTTAGSVATANYAAGVAWAYTNNGKTDWHLPSMDEQGELCKYARQQTTGNTSVRCAPSGTLRSGFSAATYWSSSEHKTFYQAWQQGFNHGLQSTISKTATLRVRPVRAF